MTVIGNLRDYMRGLASKFSENEAVWVRCEALAIRQTPTWVTWDLAGSENGQLVASAIAGCQPKTYNRVVAVSAQAGMTLEIGQEIAVCVQHHVSATFGPQFIIIDVRVLSAYGQIADKARTIKQALIKEGKWGGNRSLRPPADYVSVAVVAPPASAGLGDFRSVVADLDCQQLTKFHYFETRFQGRTAAAGIAACLSKLEGGCRNGHYDAVVVIRGGGTSADLACLVDYCLVSAICCCPVPVVTGIGHDRDLSLLDEAACINCSTPTRAAQHIRETVIIGAVEASHARSDLLLYACAALKNLERETSRSLASKLSNGNMT